MIRRPPRSTHCISSAASDVYKRQFHFYISFHSFFSAFLIFRVLLYSFFLFNFSSSLCFVSFCCGWSCGFGMLLVRFVMRGGCRCLLRVMLCRSGIFFFFFNDTATTEIYTLHIVGSVRCVQETGD
eukprot:TRINITY_DN1242_c0_g1_i13.p2 TRINITY_DN1242_c0_g1~~TRINITY_DN1242_c0_g1_i13.p2  ORF type:complete len:126 (+),score=25.74 TRINITY_DN1242_c0_g1_i13:118-495(+)